MPAEVDVTGIALCPIGAVIEPEVRGNGESEGADRGGRERDTSPGMPSQEKTTDHGNVRLPEVCTSRRRTEADQAPKAVAHHIAKAAGDLKVSRRANGPKRSGRGDHVFGHKNDWTLGGRL